jgi:SAM-dependent methyltransferase
MEGEPGLPGRKRPIDWSPEVIRRFWNYLPTTARYQELYFSRMVGRGIVRFLELTGRLQGSFLDYGCGQGDLIRHVLHLHRDIQCWGADSSAAAVERVNKELIGKGGWREAALLRDLPSPFPDAVFDVVTAVETVEHLRDEMLAPFLSDIRRILRPSGIALFTTPNEEDLGAAMLYCPFCDSEFHGMQHVRSFSVESLRRVLEESGFRIIFCERLDFSEFQRPYPVRRGKALLAWRAFLGDIVRRWQDQRSPLAFPNGREFRRLIVPGQHLCAVVERRNAAAV